MLWIGIKEADSLEDVVKAAGVEREGVAEGSARVGRKCNVDKCPMGQFDKEGPKQIKCERERA